MALFIVIQFSLLIGAIVLEPFMLIAKASNPAMRLFLRLGVLFLVLVGKSWGWWESLEKRPYAESQALYYIIGLGGLFLAPIALVLGFVLLARWAADLTGFVRTITNL